MKVFIFSLILLLLFSCRRAAVRHDEIRKIEFARSGAWSDLGVSISVDSSLNYKYWGDYQTEKQKYFVGKISQAFWDTLNVNLDRIKFKTVKPRVLYGCADCEYYELIIHWSNGTAHIFRSSGEPDDSVTQMCEWLGDNHHIPKLKQVKDSIKFETTTHHVINPAVKSIKFPPPL